MVLKPLKMVYMRFASRAEFNSNTKYKGKKLMGEKTDMELPTTNKNNHNVNNNKGIHKYLKKEL